MKRIFLYLVFGACFVSSLYAEDVSGQVRTYQIGKFDFIAIKDVETNMGKEILLYPDAAIIGRVMANNQNPSSINAFVLRNDKENILIDTGVGEGGGFLNNLKIAGVEAKNVNIVIITHMHSDHIGGLVSSTGKKVFENAVIYINEKELNYWINSSAPDGSTSGMAKTVQSVYKDKIKTFNWGENITPEIKALAAPGHTPGHTVFEIESDDEKMLVIADLVHILKVQMADPNMTVTFDINPREAADSRKKIFKDVSKNKKRIAGMHMPFPGVGTIIERTGGEYEFLPSVSVK
ncbi:MAG: MBL fold metallo-hydrolase [Endomicrobium sp.]|jgi:glyoxylase-like metal-dependent hydrolase (beta-lactamase superfamily II)|nr:MBL fold metallo-hydrolase [Endomicrobium sp.]